MTNDTVVDTKLSTDLQWLADAPLFIDEEQVNGFYDAVVRPEAKEGTTTLKVTQQTVKKVGGQLELSASASPTDLLDSLAQVFPFIKLKGEAKAQGKGERESSQGKDESIELHSIHTPQRQLVQLTLHYLFNLDERLYFVDDSRNEDWRNADNIAKVPRALAFLDLPGQDEARRMGLPETKLIPAAAEFENGKIELLYQHLKSLDKRTTPPRYPEKASSLEELRNERKDYWHWFDENFSATQAMAVVEDAASKNGRIRWIDYRVPVTTEGDTLHLHISPASKYDTGTFAYNFIKRGYKHGLRLVGTLKSEPDMNVLSIYNK